MQNAKFKMQNAKFKMQNAKFRMQNAKLVFSFRSLKNRKWWWKFCAKRGSESAA